MLLYSIYSLAVSITAIRAQLLDWGQCENLTVQASFEPWEFMGRWYEQKHTNRIDLFEANQKCVWYQFSDLEYGVVRMDSLKIGRFFGTKTYDTTTFKIEQPGHYESSTYDFKVVSTDYEKYAILHGCDNMLLTHNHLVWVLTRDRVMTLDDDAMIMDKLKEAGVPSDGLKPTIQSDCKEDNTPDGDSVPSS